MCRCEELEALESVSLSVRQMKRIAELGANLAAAEKVIDKAESALRFPNAMGSFAVLQAIAEYKKGEKA